MNRLRNAALLCCASVLLTAGPAWGDRNCERKEQILERKLAIAKTRDNPHQVAGIEQALANVRLYCTDHSLRGKAEMKLLDKREEVGERRAELEEARAKGEAKKIAKRERKLAEAEAELAEAERELKALQR